MADYSPLIGKRVRVGMGQGRAVARGILLSWRPIPGAEHGEMSAVIRRRSGGEVFVSGRFTLERVW